MALGPSILIRCVETITPRSIRDAAILRVVLQDYTPCAFCTDLYRRDFPGGWTGQSATIESEGLL